MPKGALSSDKEEDDKGTSDGEDSVDERKATGRTAGHSGRSGGIELIEDATNHARIQEGETWDQPEFPVQSGKRPSKPMIELVPGSGVYYQGIILRISKTEVFLSVGGKLEDQENEEHLVWLRLTSSRIWRGPVAKKFWSYSSNPKTEGAWTVKEAALKKTRLGRGKAKCRNRRPKGQAQSSKGEGEVTGTTRATAGHESEEEDDANNVDSPRAVKGSNAVTPEEEAGKEPFRANTSSKEGTKVSPARMGIKHDPDLARGPRLQPSMAADQDPFGRWLSGHWLLLKQRGKLNQSPDGCNPESGNVPGFRNTDSNQAAEGRLKGREASSSSGSAGHTGQGAACLKQDKEMHQDFPLGKLIKAEPLEYGTTRSPTPTTPNIRGGVGGVAAQRQRSSSADGDPRSTTAGPPGAQPSTHRLGSKSGDLDKQQALENAAKPRPISAASREDLSATARLENLWPSAAASSPGAGRQDYLHKPGPQKGSALRKEGSLPRPCSTFEEGSPPKKAHVLKHGIHKPTKGMLVHGKLAKHAADVRHDHRSDGHETTLAPRKVGSGFQYQKRSAEVLISEHLKPLPALVETDPFAEPEAKKPKA